ncbi:APC family permease [Streptomyces longisporus]|uniref:APC family permease n=1 Tax=Streptomyces longisporus TaxID=1948 RepID=A0ABP6AU98_STRLO
MSLQRSKRTGGLVARPEDERRRLSVYHLVGLAAGGVIGSGWLIGPGKAYERAGSYAWLSWLLGGLLTLLIAWVMVELGTAAPKTGGLVFLPLQSSGPLVATVVAAGLWILYAANAAGEAIAMTNGLAWKFPGLHDPARTPYWICTVAFTALICAVNLLVPRIFFAFNSALTVAKVAVPVLTCVLLLVSASQLDGTGVSARHPQPSVSGALAAVVDGGVIFAYVGFQGPLDFAGNIKRRGMGESARLRWAVFGTIVGSTALYTALQFVYGNHVGPLTGNSLQTPWGQFAMAAQMNVLLWVIQIDAVASPMGAGLVFAHSLTREVAALSRAHLTHRGLQTSRNASLRGRYDVYWLVLLVDFVVGVVMLVAFRGDWGSLTSVIGVLALVVYAVPGVVLVALGDRLPECSSGRRRLRVGLAVLAFVLIGLILYLAGEGNVLRAMATLAAGCVLLLGLPVLSRRRPALGRFYDAKEHVTAFREWRARPAAQAALVLIGYLLALLLFTVWGSTGRTAKISGGCLVVVAACAAFWGLVVLSNRYMSEVAPLLPRPADWATQAGPSRTPVSAASE